jgi:DNA-binding transcriptional LysR family regulator
MDLRDLRYFETIAELQHLGQASERCTARSRR